MAEYIEREAAIQQMADNFRQASVDGCDNQFYRVAEETLADIPAADVVEVVQGEWIEVKQYDGYGLRVMQECSLCGIRENWPANYCPNCGARMDGGKHETD